MTDLFVTAQGITFSGIVANASNSKGIADALTNYTLTVATLGIPISTYKYTQN